ncbi:LacI family DNA-binding transcriptional regulator [Cellulomonas taurus]|uniref:LacI family DNA-binding transcriptional regulator n=1 Tax=Cellulomonas taurus TaxID=2729175 RepID=UPI0031B57ED2
MSAARRSSGATMHDVAQLAGVSVKTVSNVINGYPHIRPATKSRVEDAISELDYRVNITARSLRQGRTGMIGLALPELGLPYFAELAQTIIRIAEEHGILVLIEQTNANREREIEALGSRVRHLTDGLIFSPLALGQEDVDLFDVDFPMVLLGERVFGGPTDHVTMDNIAAARAATEHLLARGRRRIAVIGAHPGERIGTAALRVQGYREAMTAAGIAVDERLVAEAGAWHRSTGDAAMTRLLDAGVEIDAVFGLNDAVALGAMHALRRYGRGIPDDVAVIGFDDTEETAYSAPTLTSVAPGLEQIARTAVDFLRQRIEGTAPSTPRQVITDFSITERQSTG